MIQFESEQMTKTKKKKIRNQHAEKITVLEKAKKKKSPIYSKNKEALLALDELFNEKEQVLQTYVEIDTYGAQPTARRVNLAERATIVENAKMVINDSELKGSLDQVVVQDLLSGNEASNSAFFSFDQGINSYQSPQQQLEDLMGADLTKANDADIFRFSKTMMGIERVSEEKFNNTKIKKNDQVAINNLREALTMRQEVEKKKQQLGNTEDPAKRKSLEEEIDILEMHLHKMQSEASIALSEANNLRYQEKRKGVLSIIKKKPAMKTAKVDELQKQVDEQWKKVEMLDSRMNKASSDQDKNKIAIELLSAQAAAIKKMSRISRILKGLPDDQYSTMDFADNGKNYTMRIKKGMVINPTIKYNRYTKIPLDIDLGPGIVYKVQVGAFKNKINPAIFNGITPLSAEDAGNGLYRYTAGIFKSITAAKIAKGKIIEIGYADAFVVAFFNGKRISLDNAKKKLDSSSSIEKEAHQNVESEEIAALERAGISARYAKIKKPAESNPVNQYRSLKIPNSGRKNSNSVAKYDNDTTKPYTNKRAGNSRSSSASGVYYTVQIGVYSTEKTSRELYGIAPLVTHMSGGLIRYSTGIFKTLGKATARKAEARAQGAADAYVAVYRDGVRISIEAAQQN